MPNAKHLRNARIKKMYLSGETLSHIADNVNVTTERVRQICGYLGLKSRTKIKKENWSSIKKEAASSISLHTIAKKYNLTPAYIGSKMNEIGLRHSERTKKRNEKIIKLYKSGVNVLELSKLYKLSDRSVYDILHEKGIRTFIEYSGTRKKGSFFDDSEVIKLIVSLKDEKGYTIAKIADELNKKGYKTALGKSFQQGNVGVKYRRAKQYIK